MAGYLPQLNLLEECLSQGCLSIDPLKPQPQPPLARLGQEIVRKGLHERYQDHLADLQLLLRYHNSRDEPRLEEEGLQRMEVQETQRNRRDRAESTEPRLLPSLWVRFLRPEAG